MTKTLTEIEVEAALREARRAADNAKAQAALQRAYEALNS